ncbi:hypothetical protein Bca101_021875 [Brassica carinata]
MVRVRQFNRGDQVGALTGEILASLKKEMSQIAYFEFALVQMMINSNEDKLLRLWTTILRKMEILDLTMRNHSPQPYSYH